MVKNEFIPFDPNNGLDFKKVDLNPITNLYEMKENGTLKTLTEEQFKKLQMIMSPNVRWIIGRYSNALTYRYYLELEEKHKV